MSIKINITGCEINGGKVLTGMEIKGNPQVSVDVENSTIGKNAKVLNNVKLQNGSLKYTAKNVKIGENARVLDGRNIEDGETVVINQRDSYYSESHTQTTQRPQPAQSSQGKPSSAKTTKKESVLEKLARILGRKSAPVEVEIGEDSAKTQFGGTSKKFADSISGNGKYRKPEYSQVNDDDRNQDSSKDTRSTQKSEGR